MARAFTALHNPLLGLDSQVNFGKYLGTGTTVAEVIKTNPEYIKWIIANTDIKFYTSVLEQLVKINMTKKTQRYYNSEYHNTHSDQDDWFDDIPF